MEAILISACLLGAPCRYDGKDNRIDVQELMRRYQLIPVCPEIYGGLPTPRLPSELSYGRVINRAGVDVTEQFEKGASEALRLARLYDCRTALLKERSPSCGKDRVYNGAFDGTLTKGDGITAKLLMEHGIRVLGESSVRELLK